MKTTKKRPDDLKVLWIHNNLKLPYTLVRGLTFSHSQLMEAVKLKLLEEIRVSWIQQHFIRCFDLRRLWTQPYWTSKAPVRWNMAALRLDSLHTIISPLDLFEPRFANETLSVDASGRFIPPWTLDVTFHWVNLLLASIDQTEPSDVSVDAHLCPWRPACFEISTSNICNKVCNTWGGFQSWGCPRALWQTLQVKIYAKAARLEDGADRKGRRD